MRIVKGCPQCGKDFESWIRHNRKYCSMQCKANGTRLAPAEAKARRLESQRRYTKRLRDESPEVLAERQRASTRAYVGKNPEKAKAATKRWRSNNREQCRVTRREWRTANLIRSLVSEARSRAKRFGVEFTILVSDVPPMGERCPLLGHPFPPANERGSEHAPSIDRIDNAKGYVPGNVWVVGYRANRLKSDGTAEEHEQIARAMRGHLDNL